MTDWGRLATNDWQLEVHTTTDFSSAFMINIERIAIKMHGSEKSQSAT